MLESMRVLDTTRLLPGPYATWLLAEMGADVVKLERPGAGDYLRLAHPRRGHSATAFHLYNQGKRSVALDLRAPEGRAGFLDLAAASDVVVDGNRPGVLDRLGCGWDACRARRPSLVLCAITAFGQDGPYRDRAAHDVNALAVSGALSGFADAAGAPVAPTVPVSDMAAGLLAIGALLAAVLAARESGVGRRIDVSMTDVMVSQQGFRLARELFPGEPGRPGAPPAGGDTAEYGVYTTADGRHVALDPYEPRSKDLLWQAIEREGCGSRPPAGAADADVRAALAAAICRRSGARWEAVLVGLDVRYAPVHRPADLPRDPHLRARRARRCSRPRRGRPPADTAHALRPGARRSAQGRAQARGAHRRAPHGVGLVRRADRCRRPPRCHRAAPRRAGQLAFAGSLIYHTYYRMTVQYHDLAERAAGHLHGDGDVVLGERAARQLIGDSLPLALAIECRTPEEAADAAQALGFPVVVKGLVDAVVHKSEHGLVATGCRDADETNAAAAKVLARAATLAAGEPVVVSVQPQVTGVELAIGVRRTELGVSCMVSAGGTLIELLDDKAVGMAPLSRDDAAALLARVRAARLLQGYRHHAAVDTAPVVDMLVAVAAMSADLPHLAELDLNPVIVNADGAYAVDVRCVLRPATGAADDGLDPAAVRRIFDPGVIAVVGASRSRRKVGGLLLHYLLKHRWPGRLVAVNPDPVELDGVESASTLAAVPGPVDLACIAVPAASVPAVVEECVAAGIGSGVVYSAGFGESGEAGAAAQARLRDAADRAFRYIGPNSIGVASPRRRLFASFGMALERHDIPAVPSSSAR